MEGEAVMRDKAQLLSDNAGTPLCGRGSFALRHNRSRITMKESSKVARQGQVVKSSGSVSV